MVWDVYMAYKKFGRAAQAKRRYKAKDRAEDRAAAQKGGEAK